MQEPAHPEHEKSQLASKFLSLTGVLVLLFLGAVMWLTDFVTLQGETTVYTADCQGGSWVGERCTGKLAAGQRYRFRALRVHEEVLFWTSGARESSSKFTECDIKDGRNWTCPANADAAATITLQMDQGRAQHDSSGKTKPFHALAKWRWLLLRWGLYAGSSADY